MNQGITNVYITTSPQFSTLVVESIKPLNYSINKITANNYEIILDGSLIMAPDIIYVFDGLVNSITVTEKYKKSIITVSLEYHCNYQVKLERQVPERLIILFDRSFLKNLLKNRVIIIDPGHGGKDLGHRGYINLLEKNVVMDIANYLKQELILYGAYAVMTREKDITLKMKERIHVANLLEAQMFISLHMNWDKIKAVNGAKGTYYGKQGKMLCEAILRELEKKPKLKNLGISEATEHLEICQSRYISQIPYAIIKACTISNPVEEGWLRSPVFKKRLATAITNGISNYLFRNYKIDE